MCYEIKQSEEDAVLCGRQASKRCGKERRGVISFESGTTVVIHQYSGLIGTSKLPYGG
jgi:hypothetical protein